MRILMLESEPGAATAVANGLQQNGHQTTACHADGAPSFPCLGMDGEHCPIDASTIDVAVAVEGPSSGDPDLASGLQGARCALRRFIPVVVVQPDAESPLTTYATSVSPTAEPDDVHAAVEQAVATPLGRHSELATDALRATLALHEVAADQATVAVTRAGSELNVVLHPGIELDEHTTEVASIRVLAAIHELDRSASRTNVTVV